MPDRHSTRRLQDAIVALQRLTNSRKLDARRAARSGVPLSLIASGVLRQVVEGGDHRPAALAVRVRMQPTALSRQLGVLERAGCIQRLPDPADGRSHLVRATRHGRSVSRREEQATDELFAEHLASWSTAEMDHLTDQFERLLHDLRAPVAVGPVAGASTPPARRETCSPTS
jgi:DNA-binding MarR family transcriptional regulator